MSLRRSSSRLTRLAARASPYHPSVTLYEQNNNAENSAGPSPKRRKRVTKIDSEEDTLTDIEDIVPETRISDTATPVSSSRLSERARKVVSPRKAKAIKQALDIPHPTPTRWQETYDSIKEMRSRIVAPVDTMGCEQAQLKELDPKVRALYYALALSLC